MQHRPQAKLASEGVPALWSSLPFAEHRAVLVAEGSAKAGFLPHSGPMPARFDHGFTSRCEEQPSTSGRLSPGSRAPPICPIRPRAYWPRLSSAGKEESSILSGLTSSSSTPKAATTAHRLGAMRTAQSQQAGPAEIGFARSPSGLTGESRAAERGAAVNTDLMLGSTSSTQCYGGGVRNGTTESSAGGHERCGGSRKRGAPDEALGSGNWKRLAQQNLPPSSSTSEGAERSCSPCPPHGMLSVLGRRRVMEDAMAIVPSFMLVPWEKACPSQQGPHGSSGQPSTAALHFFGVYDGHGGPQAANACAERLHECLAEEMRVSLAGKDGEEKEPQAAEDGQECPKLESALRTSMCRAFDHIDSELGGKCPQPGPCNLGGARCQHEPIAPEAVGTTAVVAVVTPKQIVVANCGDSRAVLSRGGVAVPLSSDHKPDREDETKRVEAAGGRVIYYNGYRVLGVLAMSRAIGDRCLKPFVIAEPEVTCTPREATDECIVLASDGLWDVMNNEEVCHIARRCITGNLSKPIATQPGSPLAGQDPPSAMAAALLTKIALSRGSGDNISVVVVNLHAVAAQ